MSILEKVKVLRCALAPCTAGSIVSLKIFSTNWQIYGHIWCTVCGEKKKKRKRVNALEETFLGYPRCRSIFMKPPHHTLIPCWATPLSPHLENEPETENRLNNQNVLFYVNGYFKHIPSQQVTAHHQLTVTHITAIKIVNHSIFSFFIRMTSWFFNCKACRERCIGSWGDIKEGILYQFLLARLTLVTQWTLVKKKKIKKSASIKYCAYENVLSKHVLILC